MFVRKEFNKSGLVSVQVIDKSSGKYKVAKTIGSSSDPKQIDRYTIEGKQWIGQQKGTLSLDVNDVKAKADQLFNQIEQIKPIGADLLLGELFDEIGFNQIDSPLFKPLVLGRIASRVKKDAYNRERGLRRLQKLLKNGKLTKASINSRGYNKYLKGLVKVSIDEKKFKQDPRWDGLKGYQTNTKLATQEIINNYKKLWKIEKAFRISKHDLKIRPIFHRVQRRTEAHICLSFAAYKFYKELERQLKEKKMDISPEKAIQIAKSIYLIKIRVGKIDYFEKVLKTK